jgi:hypothetical protein
MDTERTPAEPPAPSTSWTTGRRWEVTRVVLGIVYLVGALAHVALGLAAPEVYAAFADRALVGVYTDLWTSLVVPYLAFLQPLVVAFELGLGAALLWRGRAVLAGHAAGALFQAGLVLSGPWGPVNAVLALVHVAALRASYPETVPDLARDRLWG